LPDSLDVAGIGSMAVDRVHRAPRILAAGEKGILRAVDGDAPVRCYVGGVVLNHLGWAAALGLRVGIFGRQADDEGGRFLRAAMQRAGIEAHLQIDSPEAGRASTVAEIFVDDSGERSIYMAPGTTSETTGEHVRKVHSEFIQRARTLTTEVSQLPLEASLEALRIARDAGIQTVVDFDVSFSDALQSLGDEAELTAVLEAADILKPAKLAARDLFPELAEDPLALARAIRERFGNAAVVVTDGAAGCAIASADYQGFVPGCRAKAVDSTGAGDAFLGGLLVARHHGLGWQESGRFANACGAACVEQMGAFPEAADSARERVLGFYPGKELGRETLARASGNGGTASPIDAASSEAALHVLDVTAEQLAGLHERHRRDGGRALDAAATVIEEAVRAGGRVHVTGLGKPEHVSKYAASLFSSTGTAATFLHTTEATHGSLGQVADGDVVIAVSNSGTTRETVAVAAAVKGFGARVIAVTGGLDSPLASEAELVLDAGVTEEGGPLALAPRASIAAEIGVLAALSALVQQRSGFTKHDYAKRHPGGALGQKAKR
jgi:sugar/nucleoside kinase (ribokinase family)/D-arabinose 5-phosphate isomerase GutQ